MRENWLKNDPDKAPEQESPKNRTLKQSKSHGLLAADPIRLSQALPLPFQPSPLYGNPYAGDPYASDPYGYPPGHPYYNRHPRYPTQQLLSHMHDLGNQIDVLSVLSSIFLCLENDIVEKER